MKKFTLPLLLNFCVLTFGFAQSWQATNLTNVTYLAISELEPHNNDLYSIVFNGVSGVVYKIDGGNTSWTEVTITGTTGTPAFMKSTGNRFYLGTVGLIESNLYYSTDGTNYSLADTAGLPQETGGFARMYGLEYYNSKLVINLGSAGYWIKDDNQNSWSYINTPTALNGGVDPLVYTNGKMFAFDNSGAIAFYASSDYGSNWTTVTTDLPSGFNADIFVADPVTGRLYVDGTWNTTNYGLFYSDNDGVNWTEIDISAFITTDFNGGMQNITAFYAKGSTVYFCLENDEAMTHPNVVGSTTGITGFALDTVGLPANAAGGVHALYFTEYQGQLAMSLNVIDAYLRGIGIGVEEATLDNKIVLFPNPANAVLTINIEGDTKITSYDIIDIKGQVITAANLTNKLININELHSGIYCIRLYTNNKIIGVKKFTKE